MLDPRMTQLATVLVHHSCRVRSGDKVLIEATDIPAEFTEELIEKIRSAGGIPFVKCKTSTVERAMLLHCPKEGWEVIAEHEQKLMKQMDCYMGLRGSHNVSETSDVGKKAQEIYEETVWKKVHHEVRVNHTRWVVLRWPTASMAQLANMSTRAFEDFYFRVCTLDYAKMSRAMQPLVDRMNAAKDVRIVGPGRTDLSFSIEGIAAKPCDGQRNIPDGEVFTAPVKTSVQGIIEYNTPTLYRGQTHENVCFEFKNGKIIHATSSAQDKLIEVLDTDEGARYIGEFAVGFNPYCTEPMKDILFDEKIAGSIHFTPGSCYEETDNGNRSNIHWDLVLRQTPNVGGGELYFDGELIRKDGLFVTEDLKGLNPDHLIDSK